MITERCGIVDLIEKGDNVMADRGFEITDVSRKGATLNILPISRPAYKQLTANSMDTHTTRGRRTTAHAYSMM